MADAKIAVKSFIVADGKLLMLKRSSHDVHKPDVWEIPGGRLEIGEDPYAGLARETKEEAGLDITILHPLNVRHFVRDDGQAITMIVFFCKALHTDVVLSDEHSAFDWVPIEACKKTLTLPFHADVDMFLKLNLDTLY